jgi:Na+/proline symporter
MFNSALQPLLGFGMLLMLGFFLFLALRQAKNVTSLFKYHLYGDDLLENRFSGSLISTNASLSGAFVLILYYGFLYGPWVFPFVWLFWVITQLTSAWTINRTQSVMEAYGGWANNRATLHEFIGLVFASPLARLYCGVLSLLAYLGLIAAEIVLATYLLKFLIPDNVRLPFSTLYRGPFLIIVALMLCILIYNVLSGFRGTVQTDFSQWIIMSLMIFIMGFFVLAKWPVIWPKYTTIFSAPANGFTSALFNPDQHGYLPYISFCLSNVIFWGLWWPGAMDQWQRCAAGRTRRLSLNPIWGTVGIIPVVYFGILTFVFLFAGVWLRVSTPNAEPSPDFLRVLVADVQGWAASAFGPIVGLVFCALTLWGLVCAAMSTIDSYIMTASQSFFVDIVNYKQGATLVELDRKDTEKKLLMQARAFTIFIPMLVIGVAYVFSFASDVYALIYFAFSFMFALLPPLFAGLMGWAKPAARRACERSLLAGGFSSVMGYVIILKYLEHALRANDLNGIFRWYQAVYWWPTAVTLIGALVLWWSWPNRHLAEVPSHD